jgi:hypothetical protein
MALGNEGNIEMRELHGCNCKKDTWTAILDTMPPEKARLTVTGTCTCPTGGFKTSLRKATLQGINPEILLLMLVTEPPSGVTNQMVTDYDVAYHEHDSPRYTNVMILPCEITIGVKVVS